MLQDTSGLGSVGTKRLTHHNRHNKIHWDLCRLYISSEKSIFENSIRIDWLKHMVGFFLFDLLLLSHWPHSLCCAPDCGDIIGMHRDFYTWFARFLADFKLLSRNSVWFLLHSMWPAQHGRRKPRETGNWWCLISFLWFFLCAERKPERKNTHRVVFCLLWFCHYKFDQMFSKISKPRQIVSVPFYLLSFGRFEYINFAYMMLDCVCATQ